MRLSSWIPQLLFCFGFWLSPVAAQPSDAARPLPLLFERFETVAYSAADLLVESRDKRRLGDTESSFVRPFGFLVAALDSLGKQPKTSLFQSAHAVMVGARHFRSPAGFGAVRADRCYVIALRKGSSFNLGDYFEEEADIEADIQWPVWHWRPAIGEFGEQDPSPSSLYGTQISDSYVVISNTLPDIQSIATGLGFTKNVRMEDPVVRDWDLVKLHKIWVYRRYRHEGVIDKEAAGLTDVPSTAQALVLLIETEKSVATLRFYWPLGPSAAVPLKTGSPLPAWKFRGAGVWETAVRFGKGDDGVAHDQLVGIMWLLGFGVAA